MRVLISGGGTGGHVYPALAAATELEAAHRAAQEVDARRPAECAEGPVALLWIGSEDGVERNLVERSGLPFASVQTGAIRGRTPLTALQNIGKMVVGVRQALAHLRTFAPDVCLVTGGYVCTPVAIACRLQRVPVLIYLPDLTPGLAIRWLSLFAQKVAVSFQEVVPHFGKKAIVTGYPVRSELLAAMADPQASRRNLSAALRWTTGVDDLPLVLVFGGSQGARSINRAIWRALPDLLPHCRILHVVGERDWGMQETERRPLAPALEARYRAVAYLHEEMAWALAAADLVVARAGASTLGEFPVAALPAILVPLPISGGHQEPNARYLADAGGAVIVPDAELEQRLSGSILEIASNPQRRQQMAASMASLARPEAAFSLAQTLVRMAKHASSNQDETG